MSRRPVIALVLLAAVAAVLAPPRSRAAFTAQTANRASFAADAPGNYLRLYSQASDPNGLTGYADKRRSSPLRRAATGVDGSLTVEMGNYNRFPDSVERVFTLATPAAFPAGVSQVTVTLAVGWSRGNVATVSAVGGSGGTTQVTLGPGQKRQVNVAVPRLTGRDTLYQAPIAVAVTYAGYSGAFLTYQVPMTIYAGTSGAGP